MNFKGKTAIVTGATSGMGQDIAGALKQQGANVVASGRDQERGAELQAQGMTFVAGDVKIPEYSQSLVNTALASYGQLDLLVLSAGQLGIGKIDELSIEDWDQTIATNLSAVFYLLKYALPHLKNGGQIVVIGSVAALHAFPEHPAYTAFKGALPALIKQVALDYGPAVRINLVSPAQVKTPLLEDSVKAFENPQAILSETAERLPLKRLGVPEDITNLVLFLLSEEASWITGSNFTIDGGFLST
jgi:NAD(P)-dependent dehydrogenase (short-subunit alcohol dehydrogenase family)